MQGGVKVGIYGMGNGHGMVMQNIGVHGVALSAKRLGCSWALYARLGTAWHDQVLIGRARRGHA